MFAVLVCVTFATDPLVAAQLRYPVRRTTITTASGSVAYYTVPQDAPIELRRAYKVLELAEREVTLTESLQLLKLEYVQNERRLESLRTNALALAYMNVPGNTRGPVFYGSQPRLPESSLKQYLSRNLARDATFERSLLSIDRLAIARHELELTWLLIAYPDRRPAPLPMLPPPGLPFPAPAFPGQPFPGQPFPAPGFPAPAFPGGQVAPPPVLALNGDRPDPPRLPAGAAGVGRPAVAVAPALSPVEEARQAYAEAGRADREAQTHDRAARLKKLEAERRWRTARPEEKAEAKLALDAAEKAHAEARAEWDAARKRWQASHHRLTDLLTQRRPPPYPVQPAVRGGSPVVVSTPPARP